MQRGVSDKEGDASGRDLGGAGWPGLASHSRSPVKCEPQTHNTSVV